MKGEKKTNNFFNSYQWACLFPLRGKHISMFKSSSFEQINNSPGTVGDGALNVFFEFNIKAQRQMVKD